MEVSFGTSRLVSASLYCTCGRERGAPSEKALAKRSCRADCARWGVAELRAVRLAGAHVETSARGSELWHVQVGECAVKFHLWASAWRAVGNGAGTAEVPCRLFHDLTAFARAAEGHVQMSVAFGRREPRNIRPWK